MLVAGAHLKPTKKSNVKHCFFYLWFHIRSFSRVLLCSEFRILPFVCSYSTDIPNVDSSFMCAPQILCHPQYFSFWGLTKCQPFADGTKRAGVSRFPKMLSLLVFFMVVDRAFQTTLHGHKCQVFLCLFCCKRYFACEGGGGSVMRERRNRFAPFRAANKSDHGISSFHRPRESFDPWFLCREGTD